MHEGNSSPPGSHAWYLVHQAIPRRSAVFERRVQIGDPVANVVNPGAPFSEKLCDWAVGVQRGEQLHFGITEGQRDDRGAVRHFRRMWLQSQYVAIEGERRLEIGHGYSDMGNAGVIRHWSLPGSGAAKIT
jgi:hypothetical protein